ncbi:MAG: aminotransferase class V-fold PLP-dependent enzyme [Candidatus Vogelbacteria bacterium]|nr:aminotransferase class V-fold PLP-dependent enzyme [Candidatus Vogelbacteria bacterium]
MTAQNKDFHGLLPSIKEIRAKEFPNLDKLGRVYLDNGATTQVPKSVIDRMYVYRTNHLRGSNHSENSDEAREYQVRYEEAKQKISGFFSASNYYIALTSGATAASNLLGSRFNFEPGDLLLITDMEHNSQVLTARNYAKKAVADVKYIPVRLPDGRLDLDTLRKIAAENKASLHRRRQTGKILLMLAHVSNVTGVINPVKEIREILPDNALIYLDMAQSAGHIPINLDELSVDFAGVSAHKMYGSMGMGALFVKKESDKYLGNEISGGSAVKLVGKVETAYEESPARFEPGTQNLEGVIEWGLVIDFLNKIGMDAIKRHDRAMGEYFLGEILKINGVEVYGPKDFDERIAVITFNIGLSATNYEETARKLNKLGVSVRDGCFCAHLLLPQLLGVSQEEHNSKIKELQDGADFDSLGVKGALRATFAFYNTLKDAEKGIAAIREVAKEA